MSFCSSCFDGVLSVSIISYEIHIAYQLHI